METRARRNHAEPRGLRDLLVGEPFGVFQYHDGAIDLGKVRERAQEYPSRFGADSHRIAALLAQPHERLVHADSMKPRAEGRFGAKRSDLLESLEQALLQNILRVGVAADHSQEHSVEASFVGSHEGVERADVAGP